MDNWTESELLFYGGIAVMAVVVVFALACTVFFVIKGKKLKKKLEQDYGKPRY